MAKAHLSAQQLRELLHYDLETGVFTRIIDRGSRFKSGSIAGTTSLRGYVVVGINRRVYKAHRLAWLYVTGSWPEDQIDHINGVRHDNRWINLRAATNARNTQNLRAARIDNRTGFLGVSKNSKGRKFSARIFVNRTPVHLGCYDTPEAAHFAYLEAKRRLHAGCTI